MRLIKKQSTNDRFFGGLPNSRQGIDVEANGDVRINSSSFVLIPKGTTAERPDSPENGYIRYNTSVDEFEFYQNSAWRNARYKEPGNIVVQTLGVGDATETVFGPLNSGDINYPIPAAAQNVLVLVENVIQISNTNYTLEQNPSGPNAPYDAGWYIVFGSAVPLGRTVTVLHNFDK